MIQAFTFWFLVYFELIHFWHILFLVIFLGCVNSLNQTTRQSLINNLVPRDGLMNAVALNAAVVNLSKIVGPSLGGVTISVIGVAGCFFVNAVSFLAIIISILMMDLPPWQREKKKEQFFEEVKEGFRYARTNRRVFAALFLTYIVALVGAPYSRFLPVFASDILHVGPTGFGLLMAAPGLGAMVSGLLLASMGNIRRRRVSLFLSVIAFSLFLILFALSRSMIFSLIYLILVGSMHMLFRALANTTIQLETPSHLLGRTLSLFFMDKGLWSFGTLLIGSVAVLVGTPWAIALSGSICAASTGALLYTRERLPTRGASGAEVHLPVTAGSKPTIKS
jgi:predicted MFS family arabinose efflux permease